MLVLFLLKSENRAQATKANKKSIQEETIEREERNLSARERGNPVRLGNRGQCHVQITGPNSVLPSQWAVPKKTESKLKNSNAFWPLIQINISISQQTIKKRDSNTKTFHISPQKNVSNVSFIDIVGFEWSGALGGELGRFCFAKQLNEFSFAILILPSFVFFCVLV